MNSIKIWGIIILCLVLLGIYEALFPLPPQTILIRFFALAGFFLLCISLLVGPVVVCFKDRCGPVIKHRRRIGVLAFIFVSIHFLLVLVFSYTLSLLPIFTNLQIFLAFLALIILFLLALTSANKAISAMGFSKWKLLQRFTYVAFALSFIHFLFDANGLFVPFFGGRVFLNIAELALILLGVVTILFQIFGFFLKMAEKRKTLPTEKSE